MIVFRDLDRLDRARRCRLRAKFSGPRRLLRSLELHSRGAATSQRHSYAPDPYIPQRPSPQTRQRRLRRWERCTRSGRVVEYPSSLSRALLLTVCSTIMQLCSVVLLYFSHPIVVGLIAIVHSRDSGQCQATNTIASPGSRWENLTLLCPGSRAGIRSMSSSQKQMRTAGASHSGRDSAIPVRLPFARAVPVT
jgi:hypothetical protein